MKDHPLLKTSEAMRLLGISRKTLARYEKTKMLTPIRLSNRNFRWRASDLEKLLNEMQGRAV